MPLPAVIVTAVAMAKAAHALSKTPQGKAVIGTVAMGIAALNKRRGAPKSETDFLMHEGQKRMTEGSGQLLGELIDKAMKKR